MAEIVSRLTKAIEHQRVDLKRFYGLQQEEADFFDITPIWEQEFETFCELGDLSQLTRSIVKRLATRSPEQALKALAAARARKISYRR